MIAKDERLAAMRGRTSLRVFDADAETDPALPVFDEKTGEEIDPQPAPQD
jgi:hypothetical protein